MKTIDTLVTPGGHNAQQEYAKHQAKLRGNEADSILDWLKDCSMGIEKLKEGLQRIKYLASASKDELLQAGLEAQGCGVVFFMLTAAEKVQETWRIYWSEKYEKMQEDERKAIATREGEIRNTWQSTAERDRGQLIANYYETKEKADQRIIRYAESQNEIQQISNELAEEIKNAEEAYKAVRAGA